MRRLLAALGLIALISPAMAADLDFPSLRGSDTFVPAFPSYFRWDGVYLGGHLAYGNTSADFTHSTRPLLEEALRQLTFLQEDRPDLVPVLGATDSTGTGIGAFAGFNVQFDAAVVGFEFNYTHSNLAANAPDDPISRVTPVLSNGRAYQYTLSGSSAINFTDIGLFQGRLGWAAGHFMPFATFGAAVAHANLAVSVSCACYELTPLPGGGFSAFNFSFTDADTKSGAYLWGFTGGLGLEWALTPNIFARADYEYIQFSPVWQITSHLNLAHVGLGVKF